MQLQIKVSYSPKGRFNFIPSNTFSTREGLVVKQLSESSVATTYLARLKRRDYDENDLPFNEQFDFKYMADVIQQGNCEALLIDDIKPANYLEEFPEFLNDDMVCIVNLYYRLKWRLGSEVTYMKFKHQLIFALLATFDLLSCKIDRMSIINQCTIRLLDKSVKNETIAQFSLDDVSDNIFASFAVSKGNIGSFYDSVINNSTHRFVIFDNYELYAESEVRLDSGDIAKIGSLNVRMFEEEFNLSSFHLVQGKDDDTLKSFIPYELSDDVINKRSSFLIAAFNKYFQDYDIRLSLSEKQEITLVVNKAYIELRGLENKAIKIGADVEFKTALELMEPHNLPFVLEKMDKLCDRGRVAIPDIDSEDETIFQQMSKEQWEEYKRENYYILTEANIPPYLYEPLMICMLICTYQSLYPIILLDDTRHFIMTSDIDTNVVQQEIVDINASFNKFIHFYKRGLIFYLGNLGYLCSEQSVVVEQVEE